MICIPPPPHNYSLKGNSMTMFPPFIILTFAGKSVCKTSRKVGNFYNQSMLLSTPFNNFFYFNYLYQKIVPDAKKINNNPY